MNIKFIGKVAGALVVLVGTAFGTAVINQKAEDIVGGFGKKKDDEEPKGTQETMEQTEEAEVKEEEKTEEEFKETE